MTTLAVMQPTYMPWLGYFDLIDRADHFVLLDDVQLARRSWQTRNRICGADGREIMLSIPVRHSGDLDTPLSRVELDDNQPWRLKHGRSVQQAYARAPHGSCAAALWTRLLAIETDRLAALTGHAIAQTCQAIGIDTPIRHATAITAEPDRIDRLIGLCRAVQADTYLSTPGAGEYLAASNAETRFAAAGIKLEFQAFTHPQYRQGERDFVSHLGIVDALAHLGETATLALIRSGRRAAIDTAALAAA